MSWGISQTVGSKKAITKLVKAASMAGHEEERAFMLSQIAKIGEGKALSIEGYGSTYESHDGPHHNVKIEIKPIPFAADEAE